MRPACSSWPHRCPVGAQDALQLLIVSLGMICLYREGMSLNLFRRMPREALGVPASTMEI
jgi:hypothetical protein